MINHVYKHSDIKQSAADTTAKFQNIEPSVPISHWDEIYGTSTLKQLLNINERIVMNDDRRQKLMKRVWLILWC
jgi:hypothetical protein